MNCGQIDADMADYLREGIPAARRAELEEHAAGCPRCARAIDAMVEVWRLMGKIPPSQVRPKMRLRFDEMLATFQAGQANEGRTRNRRRWPGLLKAAAAVFLLLAGVAAGYMMSQAGGHLDAEGKSLLLIYEPRGFSKGLSPAQRAEMDREYDDWWWRLQREDRLIGWVRVSPDGGHSIHGPDELEELVPLARQANGEDLVWVVVIHTADPDEAAEVARGCPALAVGARVEIRTQGGPA